jgi:ABC-type branched-subunit amino acid transport system ATPase component
MASLHQPLMILFDEPFAGLSPQNIDFIAESLMRLNESLGITLLFIEHRVRESLNYADRIIGLKFGEKYCDEVVDAELIGNGFNSLFV